MIRQVLVLSVPSHKEETSVLVNFVTDADSSSAVVEIRVPTSNETNGCADFREFALVQ
jgi:hypothetical protein